MEMTELVKVFVDNGVTIAILIYFCARDWKFMNTLQSTLVSLQDAVGELKELHRSQKGE